MRNFTFRPKQVLLYLCLSFSMFYYQAQGQTLPANFQQVLVISGLTGGTCLAFLPDGRILVGQQNGQLRVVKNGSLVSTPAVTLPVSTSGERGLIGVAVDPNFNTNKYIYVFYTHTSGPHNRISRFTMNGDVAGSELALLDLPTVTGIYHNGGSLAFGTDGKLYIAVGDDKVGASAQNLDSYFGKILRINTDGTAAAGNPFTGGAQRSRVWAYGLRNPFTTATDLVNSKLFINDVGESTWEEVNDGTAGGRNFGWPDKEGNCTSSCTGYTNPLYAYNTNRNGAPPDGQGCAINGGAFFNGAISNYPATYNGKYFFLDYCGGWINFLNPASPTRTAFATGMGTELTYIKQGTDGNLYYISRGHNALYKIIYTGTQAPAITTQPQSISVPQGQTATFRVTATGNPTPAYQWRKGTTNISGATAATYSIANVQPSHAGQYSVVITNSVGSVTSSNATLTVTAPNTLPVATITGPANNRLFRAGDIISFSGTGTDTEDGTLPASAFEWWVNFHHANHIHPGPEIRDSVKNGTFPISAEGHLETDIWYRLYLVVKDSRGATDTTYVELQPVTSNITLQSQPAGLQLRLNDIPFTTPYSTATLSGMARSLTAPASQTLNGTTYLFDRWAHGGAASQSITTTDRDTTFTAIYKVAPAPVMVGAVQDAYVRDGATYGDIKHGTTDSTLLITKTLPDTEVGFSRQSYLTFDLNAFSAVTSVVLKVYGRVDQAGISNYTVGVFSVATTSWTEAALTWNNKPATSASPLAQVTMNTEAFTYYDWDVTSYIKSELAAGRKKVSFAMKSLVNHDSRILWNSSEAGSNPPQLAVIADNAGRSNGLVTAPAKNGNANSLNIQVYPNPFGENITVNYTLKEAGYTTLGLYDLSGKPVSILLSARSQAGSYTRTFPSGRLPAGMYLLQLRHNGKTLTRKLVRE